MWSTQRHHRQITPQGRRPALWWRQLEQSGGLGLPFAHLFPQPPKARCEGLETSERLVQELLVDAK